MINNVIIPDFLANVPNIEHCSEIRAVGNPVRGYVITAEDGWYIHQDVGVEELANIWKKTTSIQVTADPSILVIAPESELPEGAEILGTTKPETEVI